MTAAQLERDDLERTERFVGRVGVLRRLRKALEDLSRQGPRIGIGLIVGDEGVGKGRLMTDLCGEATELGVLTRVGEPRRSAYAWYRPFSDVLDDAPGEKASVSRHAAAALPAALDGAARVRMCERLSNRLRALAASRPVAIFIHELERADPFTFELLEYVARHRGRAPIVVIASIAPEAPGFPFQRFRTERFCRVLHLSPWTARDVEEYLGSRPRLAPIAAPLAEILERKTGGKPALVRQVLRLMEEEGAFPGPGGDPSVAVEALRRYRVPRDLGEVLERRLGLRPLEQRAVIRALAVLGRPATCGELGTATGLAHDRVVTSLRAAVEGGFAVERPGQREPGHEIKSRAIGAAALAGAPAEELTALHARLASYLEGTGERAIDPLELAFHHARAGHADEAARYALRAHDAILEAQVFDRGRSLYEDCLALSPSAPERARLLMGVGDFCYALSSLHRCLRYVEAARHEWESLRERLPQAACHLREAQVHVARSEYVLAARAAHQAMAIYRAEGDVLGEARALAQVGGIESSRGRYDDAAAALTRAMEMQEAGGDHEGLLDTLNMLGNLSYYLGEHAAARTRYERALALAKQFGFRPAEKRAQANLANVHLTLGDVDRAHRLYRHVLAIEKDTGDIYGEAVTHYNLGLVNQRVMRYGRSMREYRQAARLMERVGNRKGLVSALGNMALILEYVGDPAAAHALLERAWRLAIEIGDRRSETIMLVGLGVYHLNRGEREPALDYLEAALAKAIAMRERRFEMEARHGLARAAIRFGTATEARQHAHALLELARRVGEPEVLARAHLSEGVAELTAGDAARARAALMTAVAMARRCLSPALEIEARGFLANALAAIGERELEAREREKACRLVRRVSDKMGSARLRKLFLESSPRREILSGEPLDYRS